MSMSDSPTPQPVTSASQWKQSSGVGAPLRVPSGNTCLVRPMDLRALVRNNLIPNDLMGFITAQMSPKKAAEQQEVLENMDTEKLLTVMDAIDDVVCFIVVEPRIQPVPEEGVARNPDILYVDEVDYEDKMFVFQYAVGGTRNVEKFRQGFANAVESMEKERDLARPSE